VTIGDGAYTAAGSVITEDVPPGAIAVARGRQHNAPGWVERKRPGTGSAAAAAQAREAAARETQARETQASAKETSAGEPSAREAAEGDEGAQA